MELGPVKPKHELRVKATYHDACHLAHAQGVRAQPRELQRAVPPLFESRWSPSAAAA